MFMSIYQLIHIFVERKQTFLVTFLTVVIAVFVFSSSQSNSYRGEVLLSITRTALEEAADYRFDEYYRFQADERLAETLVQYLDSASGKRAVADKAKLSEKNRDQYLESKLRIAKRGTNGILVQYKAFGREESMRLGEALSLVANAYLILLNEDARDLTWFTVLSEPPVVAEAKWGIIRVVGVGFFGGIFLAFWAVLLQFFSEGYREYLKSKNKNPLQ